MIVEQLHKIEDHDDVMCWRIVQLHTHNEHVDDALLLLHQHQECIRENTQECTVVWQVYFVLMTPSTSQVQFVGHE